MLSVIRVRLVRRGGAVNNDVKYGLSSSLYTRDVNVAFRAMNELDNGITYVNAPTIGAEAHLPFGGVSRRATGTARAAGRSTSSIRRRRSATSISRAAAARPDRCV